MILYLKNDLAELDRLNGEMATFFDNNHIPEGFAFKINLAIEEIVTNIIKYGYDDEYEQDVILIEIKSEGNAVLITITDNAKEFDPMKKEDPDTNIPLEERQIGGLGIFFAKELMDSMEYKRKNNKNILFMTKAL